MTHTLQDTIRDIYDSALHPEKWQATVAHIAALLDAHTAELTVMDTSKTEPEFSIRSNIAPEAYEQYFPHIYEKDMRIPRLLALPDRGGIITENLLNDQEWKDSIELRDWLDNHEIGTLLASNANIMGMVIWLGLSRTDYDHPFNDKQIALYNMLLAHVKLALRIQLTLQHTGLLNGALAEVLDLEDKAVIILDHKTRMAFCNKSAHGLALDKTISLAGDRLTLHDKRAAAQLRNSLRVLTGAINGGGRFRDVLIFENRKGGVYGLRLLPLHQEVMKNGQGDGGRQVMVLISDLNAMKTPSQREIARFSTLFGLTACETKVVEVVASMTELKDYAQENGLKVDTPRKQLKSAMDKIGVHSQKELLRRIDRFCFLQMR